MTHSPSFLHALLKVLDELPRDKNGNPDMSQINVSFESSKASDEIPSEYVQETEEGTLDTRSKEYARYLEAKLRKAQSKAYKHLIKLIENEGLSNVVPKHSELSDSLHTIARTIRDYKFPIASVDLENTDTESYEKYVFNNYNIQDAIAEKLISAERNPQYFSNGKSDFHKLIEKASVYDAATMDIDSGKVVAILFKYFSMMPKITQITLSKFPDLAVSNAEQKLACVCLVTSVYIKLSSETIYDYNIHMSSESFSHLFNAVYNYSTEAVEDWLKGTSAIPVEMLESIIAKRKQREVMLSSISEILNSIIK